MRTIDTDTESIDEYLSSFDVSGNEPMTAEVRKPTKEEVKELILWCREEYEADWIAFPEYIAVFPNYIADSPGYVGKVMVVVWGGGPGFFQSFYWDKDGKLQEAINEFGAV